MVIAIDPAGKINLSIKRTQEAPARQEGREGRGQREGRDGRYQKSGDRDNRGQRGGQRFDQRRQGGARSSGPKEPQTFDDMLKQFMADSDSKISSIKQYSDHRTKNKRRQ